MKVILLEDVKKLGNKNDIVSVADGYARNFLFPKKMAKTATEEDIKKLKKEKLKKIREEKDLIKKFEEISKKISGKRIIIKSKGEGGKLFGSVGKDEISKHLKEVKEDQIVLDQPIKEVGEKEILIKFTDNIIAKVIISVELA